MIRAVVAALVAAMLAAGGLAVALAQPDPPDVPDTSHTWTPRPAPPPPTEPYPGAWCADQCRNGKVMTGST